MKKTLIGASIALLGMAVLIASLGNAHPQLSEERSSPQPGEVLQASPEEVRLIFPEGAHDGINAEQSFVWIVRVSGDRVMAVGGVDLDSVDRNEMAVQLEEPLEPGLYRVEWVAISLGDDGWNQGDYEFAIE